jgi:thiamine pyrophosphate-dependent acetolactate synthase large subunit-like protein
VATGAQLIVQALERAGVEVCFGLPGVHNLALWEAVRESSIRLVGVRHEQTAGYAADGYARATGRLGVALTTTGPGAANTLAAVGEAWAARSPVLVIATDIPAALRRPGVYRGVLHEATDQAAMFAPVVKGGHRPASAADLDGEVGMALLSATAKPYRPEYLEVPTDLLTAEVGALGPVPAETGAGALGPALVATDAAALGTAPIATGAEALGPGPTEPEEKAPGREAKVPGRASVGERLGAEWDLDRAVELLKAAERPLIWAGGGAVDAGPAVAALAERLAAPVLTTYGARGILPPHHPCLVDMPPQVEPAGRLWDEADLVISIGSDLDGVQTQNWAQPQPPRLLAINLDAEDASKNYRVDEVLPLDAARACVALAERVATRDGLDAVAARLAKVRAEACAGLDADALRFLDALSFALPEDAVLVVDMCIPGYWTAGFRTVAAPRRLQVPLGWGTLGYAFPAALGAALAGTGPVVSLSGDGGFLYAPGELATMAQERIPLTAVIVDDGGYGMLRYDQALSGRPTYGVDLHTPDFAALAQSFGVRAETVEGLDDAFGEALARHVEDPEPSVLVARAPALVAPPNTSPNWYRHRAG